MVKIQTYGKNIKIKKIFGSEDIFNKWLEDHSHLYILEIEHFQYVGRLQDHVDGFRVYYLKNKMKE